MNQFVYPIKDDLVIRKLLKYLEGQSFSCYLVVIILLQTGTAIPEILNTTREQVLDGWYHSPSMHLSCCLTKEAGTFFDRQMELSKNSTYFFPGKGGQKLPVNTFTRELNRVLRSYQKGICIMSLRKTFALQYFKTHGNLAIPTFQGVTYRKDYICKYLDITPLEYDTIVHGNLSLPASYESMYDTILQELDAAKETLLVSPDAAAGAYLTALYEYTIHYKEKKNKPID